MKEAKFILSVEEVNIILEALGNMPYIRVKSVIDTLFQQWNAQLPQQANTEVA
jgi:hypothetical protein